jgi:uncharacterized membrane protein YkvA (DUF1232 family)
MSKSETLPDLQGTLGFAGGLVKQGRLVWRLLHDGRIPGWVKLIPFAGLVYLLSPIDLVPDLMLPGLGQLDDLAVILLSLKLFVDLCPPGIVKEYLDELAGAHSGSTVSEDRTTGAYIDVPYRVVEPDKDTIEGENS